MFSPRKLSSIGLLLLAFSGALAAQDFRLNLGGGRLRVPEPTAVAKPAQPAEPAEPEMHVEATPFTAWLDFDRLAANRWIPGDLPDWLEPVSTETKTALDGTTTTSFRLRFVAIGDSGREIQFRLFFHDVSGFAPKVTAWTGGGIQRFEYGPLGDGLGLPTSETLTFPTAGVDFLEISVPGDGRNIRGVFLAILTPQQIQHGLDFAPAAEVVDAFGNMPPFITKAEDLALYGRVKAVIDPAGLKLAPDAAIRGTWEFPIESPPLLAVVTFEVLNADTLAPLEVILNDRPLGAAAVHWPDLADPGYLGLSRPLEKDMRFRYTGWLRCQKVIPGSALRAGSNILVLQLHPDSGPLAIRAVELQLKYNWKNLDYQLSPALP